MTKIDRRKVTVGLGALAFANLAGRPANSAVPQYSHRNLGFLNLHTGEQTNATYRVNGKLDPAALRDIDHILRDHRTDEARKIDPRLLDLLFALRLRLQTDELYSVISGYRSPRTNAMLAHRSGGVATRSLHTTGRAIDIRVAGFNVREVHRAAAALGAGGVGLYSASNFVHLDTGRVRYWGR